MSCCVTSTSKVEKRENMACNYNLCWFVRHICSRGKHCALICTTDLFWPLKNQKKRAWSMCLCFTAWFLQALVYCLFWCGWSSQLKKPCNYQSWKQISAPKRCCTRSRNTRTVMHLTMSLWPWPCELLSGRGAPLLLLRIGDCCSFRDAAIAAVQDAISPATFTTEWERMEGPHELAGSR